MVSQESEIKKRIFETKRKKGNLRMLKKANLMNRKHWKDEGKSEKTFCVDIETYANADDGVVKGGGYYYNSLYGKSWGDRGVRGRGGVSCDARKLMSRTFVGGGKAWGRDAECRGWGIDKEETCDGSLLNVGSVSPKKIVDRHFRGKPGAKLDSYLERKMFVGSPSRGQNYGGTAEEPVKFEALGSEARVFEKRRNVKVKIEKILRNSKGNTLNIPIKTNLAFKPHADLLDLPRKGSDGMQFSNRSFRSKLSADNSFNDYVEKQGTTMYGAGDSPRNRIGWSN